MKKALPMREGSYLRKFALFFFLCDYFQEAFYV